MKAVIFDLFETLITEWEKPKYTVRHMAEDLGVDPQGFRDKWEELHGAMYRGEFPAMEGVLRTILSAMNERVDAARIAAVAKRRSANYIGLFEAVRPEVLAMLRRLKEQGYGLGLISNCSPEEVADIAASQAYRLLDAPVLSCEVGVAKPDPAIYKLCMERLRAAPSDCVFVGDGGSDELAGAARCGMTPLRAAWFTKEIRPDFNRDKTWPILLEPAELFDYLEKPGGKW